MLRTALRDPFTGRGAALLATALAGMLPSMRHETAQPGATPG